MHLKLFCLPTGKLILSLRITYSGDKTKKKHITSQHCTSHDLSHLPILKDFQHLCIWLIPEDRRAQRFLLPRFASGNPAVGSDMLRTLVTSIFPDQELHLGMQTCLSHSFSSEKCPTGSLVCHLLLPKAMPVILPGHVIPSPCPCSVNVNSCHGTMGCQCFKSWRMCKFASHFECCTKDCPLLAADVGLGGWYHNISRTPTPSFCHIVGHVSVDLCWLRSAFTEASLERFRMRTSSAFLNCSSHDGK